MADRDRHLVEKFLDQVDHIIPVILGGTHTWDNVQIAHLVCNQRKGASMEVLNV
jgi:5-methylcytosine-specific restriction endonuclease McrA